MSKEFFRACFCGSTLYYITWTVHFIKQIHSTGKNSLITKKECYALTKTNGELYYVHNLNVYMYRKGKKIKNI